MRIASWMNAANTKGQQLPLLLPAATAKNAQKLRA
jgi:hypothetical protein